MSGLNRRSSVSVVVPTHNRYGKLSNLLQSLGKNAKGLVDEVIVVDDSTLQLDLPQVIHGIKVRHLRLNGRVFISRAKNLGWKIADSKYIYFIDDDNVITETTFGPMLEVMEERRDVAALMPAVLYKRKPEMVWVYATPFRSGRWGYLLMGRNMPRDSKMEGKLLNTDALPNACLVRKVALQEVGGFNPSLLVNSSAEFCQRLKRNGWQVYANTSSFILHDVEPPGAVGWWAMHGASDPERVALEISDWFRFMRMIHGKEKFFEFKALYKATGFLLPNAFAYLIRGGKDRWKLLRSQLVGVAKGLVE